MKEHASVSKNAQLLASIAALLLVVLSLWGLLKHGISLEGYQRMWQHIVDRPGGPMSFRFLLQPVMALIAALHDGIGDARSGRTPYFHKLITDPQHFGGNLNEALIATARIVLLALGMDAIYQAIVLKTFYPGEMVMVAILLALLPYILLRGPIARIARRWLAHKNASRDRGRMT
jgi:hypothetical protein